MNICYLSHSFSNQSGTESYAYNMSRAMAEMGHYVYIISSKGTGGWDFKGFEDKITVHQTDFNREGFRGSWRLEKFVPLYTWRYGRLIKKILPDFVKKYAIDIIETNDWSMDTLSYIPQRKVPVCVRLQGYPGYKDDFEQGILKKWPKNHLTWSLFRKHILGADLVTGVSKAYINFVRQAWEIKDKEIQPIPIGIDLKLFYPSNLPNEGQVIFFAGRLEESKGIKVLAQAMPLVLKEFPKAKFYFAGRDFKCNDSQETWSQRLIQDFGRERIIYLGSLLTPELIRHYQSAAICVMPSLYEPGGIVALEAIACGCPVIASKAGGLAENIKDRQSGLLVPPGDARALADAVIELLQKPQMRQQLSQNGLEHIRKDYDLNVIARQTLDAYSQTIKLFKAGKN